MLNLVKVLSYSTNPVISVAEHGFPEYLWCRKNFTKTGEVPYHKTKLYGCVIKEVYQTDFLSDIAEFFVAAYDHPEHVTIYSHVDELYSSSKYEERGIGMHISGEFFKKDSKYKTNVIFFDMDSIPVDFDVTDISKCGEFIAEKLNQFNSDIFPSNLGYVVKPSGSSGVKSGLRNHFVVLNRTEISIPQLKALAVDINTWSQEEFGYPLCDPSIYSDARKLYLSRPRFDDQNLDPYFGDKYPLVLNEGEFSCLPETFREHVYAPKVLVDFEEIDKLFNSKNYSSFDLTDENLNTEIYQTLSGISTGEIDDEVMNRHIHRIFYIAIQEGYDLKYFCDHYVTPALSKYASDRQKHVDQYLDQAKYCVKNSVARVSRQIEKDCCLMPLEIAIKPAIGGYLNMPIEFPEINTINFLKASLGTGKTTTVRNLMLTGKLSNVIAITNRVSLAKSNASKLGISFYNEVIPTTELKNGGLSICVNSLSKTVFDQKIKSDQFDTLFIDEADSMMQDLLTASTFSSEAIRIAVLENLKYLLCKCKYVILADGDMSSTTVKAFMELQGNVKIPRVFVTEVATHNDVKCFEYLNENEMHGALLSTVECIGQKSLVVTDFSPEKIRDISKAIEMHCESNGIYGIKVMQIHSDSTSNSDVDELLRSDDPTTALYKLKPDVVITSPTVTSGIDFQGYFQNVFCYTASNLNEPSIRLQALCRERKPECIHLFVSKSAESSYVDEKIITSSIVAGDNSFIGRARLDYIKRALMEREKYRFFIRYNMLKKGVEYSFLENKEFAELWDDVAKVARMQQLKDYVETVMLSTNQFIDLSNKNSAREFKKEVAFFSDLEHIDLVTEDHILAHHKSKAGVKAKNLHALITKVRHLWDELEALRLSEIGVSKSKDVRTLFLKYLPALTVAGVRFDRDRPLQTLRKFGFDVEMIVLADGTKTTGIKTWSIDNAEMNLRRLHAFMGDKYDLPDFIVKQDELAQLDEDIEAINEI